MSFNSAFSGVEGQQHLLGLLETLLGSLEVDHLPDGLEVVGLDVLVLQVECVLPCVHADQGNMGYDA